MATINLDSLSTFWQSVKAYFADVLLYRTDETVLYEDATGVGSNSTVQLSKALSSGHSYRVTFRTNDNVGYTQTFRWYNSAANLFMLIAVHNSTGSTERSYLKISRVNISSDLKTLTVAFGSQTNINASSTTTTSANQLYITKVVETVI